jgi:hypothetical protein
LRGGGSSSGTGGFGLFFSSAGPFWTGVSRDHADDATAERALDQRRMHFAGQIAQREFGEGSGKRGFGGDLGAALPTEDATQGLVDREALDQGGGGGYAQDRLGDEGPGEGAAVFGRPTRASGRFGHEGLEADHVERGDEAAERFGQGINLLAKPSKQRALDAQESPHFSRLEKA